MFDLLNDPRVPEELRRALQGCSFEAEVLNCIGCRSNDGTPAGYRCEELRQRFEKLAEHAMIYVYGKRPESVRVTGPDGVDGVEILLEDVSATLVLIGGAILATFCVAAGCVAFLL